MTQFAFPPHVLEVIQQQLAALGRIGATKVMIMPELATAIPVGAPATDASPQPLRFREPGVIIGAYGQVISDTAGTQAADALALATTRIQVLIGGTDSLFSDGQTQAFVPFLALFGGPSNWFPLWREGVPGVDWTVTYRNRSTTATKIPDFMLAFIAYDDLARMGLPRDQLPSRAGAPYRGGPSLTG